MSVFGAADSGSIFDRAREINAMTPDEDELYEDDLGEDGDIFAGVFSGGVLDDDDDDDDIDNIILSEPELSPDGPGMGDIPAGRVAMARRVRRTLYGLASPTEAHRTGYFAGYLQCAQDLGRLDPTSVEAAYGGVMQWIGRGLGGVAKLALATGQGFIGDQKLTDVARDIGAGARSGMGVPQQGAARDVGQALGEQLTGQGVSTEPAPQAPVEATKEELPPVYVADTEGAEEYLSQAADLGIEPQMTESFEVEEQFGGTARFGVLGRQRRERSRTAVSRAMSMGARRLAKADRHPARVFVRDHGADAMLFSDGRIQDAVYGRLQMVPCPSCARVRSEAAYGGVGNRCVACSGYGAILVPDDDVESFSGIYGALFLSLLGSAAAAGIGAANQAGMLDKQKSSFRRFAEDRGWGIADSKALDPKPDDESASFGGAQMIAPQSWVTRKIVGER